MKRSKIFFIFLVGLFFLAFAFRFYGVNWDQDQHLHPDERFLTMVTGAISWPDNIWGYFQTAISPLNPHNRGFGFFVYGTFPIFLTKKIAELTNNTNYGDLTLLGRQLSAFFDMLTLIFVYLISFSLAKAIKNKSLSDKKKRLFPLFSSFFYGISVLPIQLSHFYAVDTFLTFFLILAFYFLVRMILKTNPKKTWIAFLRASGLGISFGLAISSKISAIIFTPIIVLGLLIFFVKDKRLTLLINIFLITFFTSYLTVRIAQPYAFYSSNFFDITLNPKLIENWKQLDSFNNPESGYPPGVQWIKTRPFLFPLKNIFLWGLGAPFASLFILSCLFFIFQTTKFIKKKSYKTLWHSSYLLLSLALVWIILVFSYQGIQYVKALRYFFPSYPFIMIITGWFAIHIVSYIEKGLKSPFSKKLTYTFITIALLVYPFSFMSIYRNPHTRIQASDWIYKHIPRGSNLSGEHWDDFLPMSLGKNIREIYNYIEYPLYGVDNEAKWKEMDNKLKKTDYIILSSNRLYGSLTTVPEKYPITYRYYKALFDGSLGFAKQAEFTSRPRLPIPFISLCLTPPLSHYGIIAGKDIVCEKNGISFVDDYADETFTVYDHPKVIIFKKVKNVDYFDLLYNIKI